MATPFRTYRIWQDGAHWRWEVSEDCRVMGHGYEKTSVEARARAMIFALSVEPTARDGSLRRSVGDQRGSLFFPGRTRWPL